MSDDTTVPATRGDLRKLDKKVIGLGDTVNGLDTKVDRLERKMDGLESSIRNLAGTVEKGFRYLHEADDQILTVLINVDKRLTGKVADHEKRIVHLEGMAA